MWLTVALTNMMMTKARMARTKDTVESLLLGPADAPPLGAGEPSMGPTVAAIAAGIHAALGVHPRALPFTAENIAAAMEG